LKKLWKLTEQEDEKKVDQALEEMETNGVFLPDMTREEQEQYMREEQGWKGLYNKVREIVK